MNLYAIFAKKEEKKQIKIANIIKILNSINIVLNENAYSIAE